MRVGAIERDGDNNRRVISCVYGEKYDVERLHSRSFGGVVQKDDMRMGLTWASGTGDQGRGAFFFVSAVSRACPEPSATERPEGARRACCDLTRRVVPAAPPQHGTGAMARHPTLSCPTSYLSPASASAINTPSGTRRHVSFLRTMSSLH